jgi:hypothetical protein
VNKAASVPRSCRGRYDPDGPAPYVDLAVTIEASHGVDAEAARAVLAGDGVVRSCYGEGYRARGAAALTGRLRVRITVDEGGCATRARILASRLPDRMSRRCLVDTLSHITVAGPAGSGWFDARLDFTVEVGE